MMNRVATHTNNFLRRQPVDLSRPRKKQSHAAALARGVASMTDGLDAKLVVLWAQFDDAVLYISQNRLGVPILACSSRADLLRRMQLLHGVKPVSMAKPDNAADFLHGVDQLVRAEGWAAEGDSIVCIYGERRESTSLSNLIYVHQVGSL